MTSVHLLVSKKKPHDSLGNLLQANLSLCPNTGYPRQGLFGPLLFLQPFGHLLISPFVKGKVKGRTKR